MKSLKKTYTLSNKEYFTMHMNIVNALLPIKLTIREIEVLGVFMSFTGTLANNRFCTSGKSIVRDELGISSQSIWNIIENLKKKNIIINNDEGNLDILPILFPNDSNEQSYYIKLINKDNKK